MKKFIFTLILLTNCQMLLIAQINREDAIKKKGSSPIKNAPIIPSAPTQQPPAIPTPRYFLTDVKVKLNTGNDNKEYPSKVLIDLFVKNIFNNDFLLAFRLPLINAQLGNVLINELPINSNMDFGLIKDVSINLDLLSLEHIQKNGLTLDIFYLPNFILDAWKINGVELTVGFKDQSGNSHPTLGNKIIKFNSALGLLTSSNFKMVCSVDGTFTITSAAVLP